MHNFVLSVMHSGTQIGTLVEQKRMCFSQLFLQSVVFFSRDMCNGLQVIYLHQFKLVL